MAAKRAPSVAKRRYTSTRRALQADRTRADVVQAAVTLFGGRGWAGTTLAAVAEEAGVAVETVYKGFGSKKALLRAAMDAAIVGDAEPVPFADRPEFAALGEGAVEERIARAVSLAATIHERSAGTWLAVVEAAGSDPELDSWRLEMEQRRRLDVKRSVERVVERSLDDQVTTALWILFGPETYLKLVVDSGYSLEEYEAFLRDAAQRFMPPTGA